MIKLSVYTLPTAKWERAFPKMKEKIEQAAALAFLNAKKPAAFRRRSFEITVALENDAVVKSLNRSWRGKNKPTNVLSFPQIDLVKFKTSALSAFPVKEPVPLGDVVLAFETVRRECREQEKSMENHVIHLVVHGVLHLLGYDHMRVKDAKIMEKLECDILNSLGYPPPYET